MPSTFFATFYSFKGGVGRTLTLVNTAVALTQQGHSVIIWDMDIEAPGVQNIPYFSEPLKGKVKGGFVDIAADFKKNGYQRLTPDTVSRYLVTHPQNQKLSLLLTGNLEKEEEYPKKFSAIEWEKLFGKNSDAGYRLFEAIREELLKYHPDYVLIDSRTGFTDIGGVCGLQLPDLDFLVFTYGNQNLSGIAKVHRSLTRGDTIKLLRPDRPLKTYLIASMVPVERPELKKKRRADWEQYNLKPHVEVPYNPEMVFNETVWTAEYPDDDACEPYRRIANILIEERENLQPQKDAIVFSAPLQVRIGLKGEFETRQPSPEELFEIKVADLFRLMNYEAEVNKAVSGSQIDIFLTFRTQLETNQYIVECKHWEKNIGKEIVDEVENNMKSARREYPTCRAIIVAKKGFTKEAKEYAASLNITLRTYDELLNGIINFDRYVSSLKTLYAGTELEKNYIDQAVIVENSDGAQPLSQYVDEWLDDPQAGFFTLLGDYGTGKTSFTKKLAHDMAVSYEKGKLQFRVPVLINLKDVSKALSLENIIFDHFSRTAQMSVRPETVLYLLKEGRLLLIFDGFDEMATQTNAALTMKNFMELNRAFAGSAKVILTCRTHYFKDRAETEETLKAKKRGLSESATELYRAIQGKQGYTLGYLQEFSSRQIEEYLKKTLPDQWRDAKATIDSVYNLKDLSSRPVLLDMIVKSLPKIREKAGTIQAADLYAAYVQSWIDREDWRHELTREGREFLAEEMAERIWAMETDRVHHSLISDVLKDYLQDKKSVVSVSDIELASSEVRTASFLIRDDEGNYGFAHRSFMEFFLAQRIAKRLKKVDTNCLRLKRLSKEVILFLSQLADNSLLIETARKVLSQPYQKMISENALFIYYWTLRYKLMREKKPPSPEELKKHFQENKLDRIFLDGADLERADLTGVCLENAQMNNARLGSAILTGADLQQTSLIGADFSFVALDHADLRSAHMTKAKANHCSFNFASMNSIDLTETDLHSSSLISTDMTGAQLEKTDLSSAGLLRAKGLPQALTAFGMGLPDTPLTSMSPSVQRGHSTFVLSAAFSPDGRTIATGSWDNTARLWDVASGKEIRALQAHSDSVSSVAFSPDGRTIVTGSWDKTARLWNVETGREVRVFQAHAGPVLSVAFSPDVRTIATGSRDKTARLWNVEAGREIRTLQGHSDSVTSVAFSPDGRTIATGSRDKTARLWDVVSGKEIRALQAHSGFVTSVVFSPDGRTIATGSWDNTARLWNVETGREIRALQAHSGPVTSVVFSPDGKIIVTGSRDNTARLWNMETSREIRALQAHSGPVTSVAFSPDSKTIATGSWDKTARLWDVASGKEIRALQAHSDSVLSVAFSPDSKIIATGSRDKTARLWDVASGKEIRALQAHSDSVFSVAFSPDGRTIATGSWGNMARIWDIASGKEIRAFQAHSGFVTSVAFSRDGRTIATGSGDNTARIWDIETGRKKQPISRELVTFYHLPDAEWAAIAPDNRFVCSEGAKPYIYFADRLALYSAYDLPELEQPEGLALTGKIRTTAKGKK